MCYQNNRKGKKLQTPIKEEFKGLHEAIIEKNIFYLAQTKLKTVQTNKHSDYQGSSLLLLQKLTCGTCGAKMTTTFTKKKNKEKILGYTCSTKHKKGNSVCDCKDISALAIERFAIDLVHQIGSSEKLFDSVFEQFLRKDDSEQKLKEEKLIELRKNLLEIKAESKRLIIMVAKMNL